MGEFLYGLVRMLKPNLVVETGTYKGRTANQLYLAVVANGLGRFVTCDPYDWSPAFRYPSDYRKCSSLDLQELREADLVFSDSDQNIRNKEYALVKPGCVFVVHDTGRSYNGNPDAEWLGKWVREQGGLTFNAGRGFGILVKAVDNSTG
jgi:hypothetical protein